MRNHFPCPVLQTVVAALLALALAPAFAAAPLRPMSASELVLLERVNDPRMSPDGRWVVYQLLETDLAANRSMSSLWLAPVPEAGPATPEPRYTRRLTAPGVSSFSPRWRADGKMLFFLSTRSGGSQVWRLDLAGGEAQAVTHSALEITNFMVAPDSHHIVVSMHVFPDCEDLDCSKHRMEERSAQRGAGRVYDRMFIRHWDSWADGTRSQLFAYALDEQGIATGNPLWLSRGLDADIPSKPFGDDNEWSITPDSRELIFAARVAGSTEPWSTNFDLYRVAIDGSAPPRNLTAANEGWDTSPAISPDGRFLAYRAQKRAGFESDRFAIMLMEYPNGEPHELLPQWDRSALLLRWSADGKFLYTVAEDTGQRRLFAIEIEHGRVTPLTDQGTVRGFDAGRNTVIYALDNLAGPAQLYRIDLRSGRVVLFTHHNREKMAGLSFGEYQQFTFKGWNNEAVHGYVVKPAGYEPGRKYPVLLLIHGGPENSLANEFHYHWNAQLFAGAGYAVLMIDFHGSTGYGQAFTDAIRGHWGDRPLEDLQKGWRHALASFPFLDGARACALGGSYGGYMTNWIAGNWRSEPTGAWKCLVTDDGVFDSRMMAYSSDELWFEEWEHEGAPFAQPQNFERFNPVNHVQDWSIPMLVIHGAQDFRVPLEQGIAAFAALQRRGVPSRFLYFPEENHWVLKPQDVVRWHEVVAEWLTRWTAAP